MHGPLLLYNGSKDGVDAKGHVKKNIVEERLLHTISIIIGNAVTGIYNTKMCV